MLEERGGRPVGFVGIEPARDEPGVAHLFHLFVLPAWWGSGVAADLLAAAVAAAREAGFCQMRLCTPAGQGRARAFYRREGWRETRAPFDEPELGFALVEMRRDL